MKFKTFYRTYYTHRIKKASILLKCIIFFKLPFNYLINRILYPSVIDLDKLALKKNYLFNKNLEFLFQYFNSDKGNFFFNQYDKPIKKDKKLADGHSYHKFYEKFFQPKKSKASNILELGSFKGNATAAFYFYFKDANFISCDLYTDFFLYKSKRIKQLEIDNSSEIELKEKIINKNLLFDIIIEDAGHYLKDQIISLFILFQSLKPGGIFVTEELDFPDTRDDMNIYKEKPTLREILNMVKNDKDFESKYVTKDQKNYFMKNIDEINIFKGKFNEIVFIRKR